MNSLLETDAISEVLSETPQPTGLDSTTTQFVNEHSTIYRPVWLNGWVFFYKLSGCVFESRCSYVMLYLGNNEEQNSSPKLRI